MLAVVRIGKILENSTDYSIQNTIRQALFLPTSREAKYKAKAAIDTFCTRLGDVLSRVRRAGTAWPWRDGLRLAQRGADGRCGWWWRAGLRGNIAGRRCS